MPVKKPIKYTPAAVDDMDEIFSYISRENVASAENMLDMLNSRIRQLAEFSHMGAVLPEEKYPLIDRGYRFIVVQPYLIFYRIMGETIIIYRILHGRRDYLRELFDSLQ